MAPQTTLADLRRGLIQAQPGGIPPENLLNDMRLRPQEPIGEFTGADALNQIRRALVNFRAAPAGFSGMARGTGLDLLNLIQKGRRGGAISPKESLAVPIAGGAAGLVAGPGRGALVAGAPKGVSTPFAEALEATKKFLGRGKPTAKPPSVAKVAAGLKKTEETEAIVKFLKKAEDNNFDDIDLFEIGRRVMDADRAKRAEELGFNLDAFHGTEFQNFAAPITSPPLPPFRRFDPSRTRIGAEKEAGGAAFLSSSEEVARTYGREVFPLKVNTKNAATVDFRKEFGKPIHFNAEITGTVIEAARRAGKDVVIIKGMRDVGDGQALTDQIIVLNPAAVRSSLAAFDPKKVKSDDLLSVNGPAGLFVSVGDGRLGSAEFEQTKDRR